MPTQKWEKVMLVYLSINFEAAALLAPSSFSLNTRVGYQCLLELKAGISCGLCPVQHRQKRADESKHRFWDRGCLRANASCPGIVFRSVLVFHCYELRASCYEHLFPHSECSRYSQFRVGYCAVGCKGGFSEHRGDCRRRKTWGLVDLLKISPS